MYPALLPLYLICPVNRHVVTFSISFTEEGEATFRATVHAAKRKPDENAATSPSKRVAVARKVSKSNAFISIKNLESKALCRIGVAQLCGKPAIKKNAKLPMERITMDNMWELLQENDLVRAGHGLQWIHGAVSKNVNMDERLKTFIDECYDDNPHNPIMELTYRRSMCYLCVLDGCIANIL